MTQPRVESLDSGQKDFGLVLNLRFTSLVSLEQVIYLLGVSVSPLINSRKMIHLRYLCIDTDSDRIILNLIEAVILITTSGPM